MTVHNNCLYYAIEVVRCARQAGLPPIAKFEKAQQEHLSAIEAEVGQTTTDPFMLDTLAAAHRIAGNVDKAKAYALQALDALLSTDPRPAEEHSMMYTKRYSQETKTEMIRRAWAIARS
jgi:hypothetical protein